MPSNETRAYLIFQAAVAIAAGAMADPAFAPKSNETLADWAIAAATPIYDKTIGALPAATPNYIRPKEPEPEQIPQCPNYFEPIHAVINDQAVTFIDTGANEPLTPNGGYITLAPPPSEEGIPEQPPAQESAQRSRLMALAECPRPMPTECMHGKPIAGECKQCEEMLF